MDIVIPLGGKGKRFSEDPSFAGKPKPLIDVLGKPMIFYTLDCVIRYMHDDDLIYILYDPAMSGFVELMYAKYPSVKLIPLPYESRGAADTVHMCLEKSERPMLLVDCDTFYTCDLLKQCRKCVGHNAVFFFEDDSDGSLPMFSYVDKQGDKISDIREKVRISTHACSGAYFFDSRSLFLEYAYRVIQDGTTFNGEYYTSCVIHEMLKNDEEFRALSLDPGTYYMLGTPRQVLDFSERTFAFLFDLDGTLISSDHVYHAVWSEIMRPYHVDISFEMFCKYIQGRSDKTALQSLIPNAYEDLLPVLSSRKDALFCEYIEKSSLIHGSLEYLRQVKKSAHKIFIVTNCNRKAATRLLELYGFMELIDGLIVGGECEEPKPSPHPYLSAISLSRIPIERCIVFEDSETGIASARAAGVPNIITIGGQTHPNFSNLLCDFDAVFKKEEECEYMCKVLKRCVSEVSDVYVYREKMTGGFVADVFRVKLMFGDQIIPAVVKSKSKTNRTDKNGLLTMAEKLSLYDREQYFYEKVHAYALQSIRVPRYLGTVFDPDTYETIGVLLEDMNHRKNVEMKVDLNTKPIETTLRIVDRLAKMHASFFGKGHMFPSLMKNDDTTLHPFMSNYVRQNWEAFEERWKDLLSESQLECGRGIARMFADIQSFLTHGCKLTLCHGDVKSANMFLVADEPYFIDWQYMCMGSGTQDLAFFMIESFEAPLMCNWESMITKHYLLKLNEYGMNMTESEFRDEFTCACCFFPFFVSVWFGVSDEKDLVDVNFPFFFIQRYFSFLERHVSTDALVRICFNRTYI